MSIEIKNQLDPIFEILGLLTVSRMENWEEEVVKQLDEYGINGESFFRKHMKIVEKYVETFKKFKVSAPGEDFFFQNAKEDLSLMIFIMAVENRACMESGQVLDSMKLRSFLAFYITDTVEHAKLPEVEDMPQLPDEKAMIAFLDHADIKNEEKWYVLDLLRRPDFWFSQLFENIRLNIPAFEKAKAAVEKPLEKLFKEYAKSDHKEFMKLASNCADNPVIYGTLIAPLTQAVSYSYGYEGLMCGYLEKRRETPDSIKENMIRCSKSFGDKSKLDILCSLKTRSKYNLELADALNLSPSTTSHHMSILMSCGLVTVEKREGKVYYCLQKENIRAYIQEVERLLI